MGIPASQPRRERERAPHNDTDRLEQTLPCELHPRLLPRCVGLLSSLHRVDYWMGHCPYDAGILCLVVERGGVRGRRLAESPPFPDPVFCHTYRNTSCGVPLARSTLIVPPTRLVTWLECYAGALELNIWTASAAPLTLGTGRLNGAFSAFAVLILSC
ncbi:hypothetical protein PsYK624_054430 [Phanerochaete sordida]|uniref:Uncharacterized protein n=1 Tax=Phanerochaete sordida TaxID=48140 RepID=A0A9P3G8I1_9APHY|nr:hypothetical protein PsYK624_054430 [Phanerochaete sordida]